MKYLGFVVTEGHMPDEAVAEMNAGFPAYFAEMEARGVRLYGRELDEPGRGVTVRVRDGETLVADGPFAETKEFIGGFDIIDCGDLDEAIEIAAGHPLARYHRVEVREFAAED